MARSHIPSLACRSAIDGSSDGLTPQLQRIIAWSLRHSRWRAAEVMGQVSEPCNIEQRYQQKTSHSSPLSARYGASLVDPASYWYSTSIPAIINGTRLYMNVAKFYETYVSCKKQGLDQYGSRIKSMMPALVWIWSRTDPIGYVHKIHTLPNYFLMKLMIKFIVTANWSHNNSIMKIIMQTCGSNIYIVTIALH